MNANEKANRCYLDYLKEKEKEENEALKKDIDSKLKRLAVLETYLRAFETKVLIDYLMYSQRLEFGKVDSEQVKKEIRIYIDEKYN